MAFRLAGAKGMQAVQGGKREYQALFDYPLSGKNSIVYPEVLPSADMIYTSANGTLKEFILLKDGGAASEFRFRFETNGLLARTAKDGTVEFINEKGEKAFELSPLFAVDAAGAYTDKLKYNILSADTSSAEIAISVSKDYLSDPARVFPILIDPSVMVTGASTTYDTFVASNYPTSNYYMSTSLCTGKDTTFGVRWSYLKFDLPSNIASGAVTGAYINIRKSAGATPSVKAYRVTTSWTSSTVNWNNKPSFLPTNAAGPATPTSDNWYRIYLTDFTKQWLYGTYPNHGVLLRDATENNTSQWTSFYSSDAASPNKPELVINYTTYTLNTVSVRKITDKAYCAEYPSYMSRINDYMTKIARPFKIRWNIEFSHYSWSNNLTLPASDCPLSHNQSCHDHQNICGTNCVNSLATPNHHKNHHRNWYTILNLGKGNADITIAFLGFLPCEAGGLSADWLSSVCQPNLSSWTEAYNINTLRHEISHLFGCRDGECTPGQKCIMSGGFDRLSVAALINLNDIWCDQCQSRFNRLAH